METIDLDDLTHAHQGLVVLLRRIGPEDWDRPTACEAWDAAAVVRHLVVGERAFTASLGGVAYDLPVITGEVAGLGIDDLPGTYGGGAERLREALGAAAAGAVFPTGLGPMPAAAIAHLRTIEALAHGWDLARACDQHLAVDDAVAARAIGHSLALMTSLPPDRTPFGPPQPVPDDAPALDRLAGLLGRRVR